MTWRTAISPSRMAKKAGCQCVAIEALHGQQEGGSEEIADTIGISIGQTKPACWPLCMEHGQPPGTNARPQAIGDKAAALCAPPLFANIADDVARARVAILKQHKLNRQGGLVELQQVHQGRRLHRTAAGAPDPRRRSPGAADACIEQHPGEIVLVAARRVHGGQTAGRGGA